jgi:hypothetical protein
MPKKEKQHLCSDLISIQVRTSDGRERNSEATLETISARHAGVQTDEPLAKRSTVRLLCANCEFRGKVVGCRYYEGLGYHSEIQFEPGQFWSPESYRPHYLLDPGQLGAAKPACCEDESKCPRAQMAELLAPGIDAIDRVERVARAVAAICGDLDEASARRCFSRLFEIPPECRMGGEFAKAYTRRRREITGRGAKCTLRDRVRAVTKALGGAGAV